jgi:hypothetical protein
MGRRPGGVDRDAVKDVTFLSRNDDNDSKIGGVGIGSIELADKLPATKEPVLNRHS